MPIVDIIGGVFSVPGGVQTGQGSSAAQSGTIRLWRPHIDVIINGVSKPHVISATVLHGLDLPYATATIEFADDPEVGNDQDVEVIMGAGLTNATRFRGLVKRREGVMWPHSRTVVARGRLALAYAYQQAAGIGLPSFINQRLPITGLSIFDLLNGAEPTDENIVRAVLNRVPNMNVDPADIGGTGKLFGRAAWRDLTWSPYQTALNYIQELDKVCLGYRTFESFGGRVRRWQIRGHPSGPADREFTEGVDVWEASGVRSVEELINGAYIEGYPYGSNPGIINAYVQSENDLQGETPHVTQFSSPLIEGVDGHETLSNGLTPHDVAIWKIAEGNRELVNVDYVTFVDDIISPGRTVTVNIPHIGVTEPVWVQRVEIRIMAEPTFFMQRFTGFGGGLADGPPAPPPY